MNIVKNPQYKTDKRRGRPERRKTPLRKVLINRENLAWAAGFTDGEGCFCINSSTDKWHKRGRSIFSIGQVDRRALDRFKQIVGVGKIYGPYGPYNGTQATHPHFQFDVYGFEQVQALTALLWTWLGPVKKAQAKSVLQRSI